MISGADGGTGASPLSSIKHGGGPGSWGWPRPSRPWWPTTCAARCKVRVDGGFKTGRDVLVAALLGADEYGFGTAALLAEGCLMVRTCHQDNCPVGIATQRPDPARQVHRHPGHGRPLPRVRGRGGQGAAGLPGLRAPGRGRRPGGPARPSAPPATPGPTASTCAPLLATGATERRATRPRRPGSSPPTRSSVPAPSSATGSTTTPRPGCATATWSTSGTRSANTDRAVGASARGGRRQGVRFAGRRPAGARIELEGTAGQSFGAFLAPGSTCGSRAPATTTSARAWAAAAS